MSFFQLRSPGIDVSIDIPVVPVVTTLSINVSDSITIAESLTIIEAQFTINVSDSTTVADVVQMQIVDFINVSDSTTTGESVQMQIVDFVSVSDSTTTAESATIQERDFISVSDSTTTGESVTLLIPYGQASVSDSTTVAEAVTIEEIDFISVSDATTVAESVTIQEAYNVSVSDSTTTAEALTIEEIYFISVSDSTTTAESVQMQVVDFISVSDATTTAESFTAEIIEQGISVSDSTTVAESVQLQIVDFINVSDSTTTGESVQMQVVDSLSVVDSITTTDVVQMQVVDFVSVSDSTTTAESVQMQVVDFINVSDSTTVAESLTIREAQFIVNVSDSTTVTEAVTIQEVDFISVSDATTATESLTPEEILFINAGAPVITQYINMLVGDGWSKIGSGAVEIPALTARLNTSDFDGTVQYFFEANLINGGTASQYAYARLYNHTDSVVVAGSEVSTSRTSSATVPGQRLRSGPLSLSGDKTYTIQVQHSSNSASNTQLYGARLVVVQSGTITKTQVQIELGNELNTTSTSNTNTNDRLGLFLYEASKYDGTLTFRHDVALAVNSSANTGTSGLYDITGAAAVGSSSEATSNNQLVTDDDSMVLASSGTFSLIDGHVYRPTYYTSAGTVYTGTSKLVITITGSPTKFLAMYPAFTGNNANTTSTTFTSIYDNESLLSTTDFIGASVLYYHEATFSISNAAQTATVALGDADTGTPNTIAGTSVTLTGSTASNRVRSAAFTPSTSPTNVTAFYETSINTATTRVFLSYVVLEVSNLGSSEGTTVIDTATVQIAAASGGVNVSDSTTVGESLTIEIIDFISVSDSTTTGESVQMQVVDFISVSDSTTTADILSIQEANLISVIDIARSKESFGTAAQFASGATGTIVSASGISPTPTNTTSMSLAIWVKLGENAPNDPVTLRLLDSYYSRLYIRSGASTGDSTVRIRQDQTVAMEASGGTIAAGDTSWHHVVGTYNWTGGTNSTLKVYFDGVIKATTNDSVLPTSNSINGVRVGNTGTIATLADARVWLGVLSDTDVTNLYNTGQNPDDNNPVVWYPMTDGTGTTITDFSGNANNGTMSGTASLVYGTQPQAGNIKIQFTAGLEERTFVTESVTVRVIDFISVSDSTTVDDSVLTVEEIDNISVSDATTVTESLSLFQSLFDVNVSDSTTVDDVVQFQVVDFISVSDATTTTEALTIEEIDFISVSDSTTTGESVTVFIPAGNASISDSTTTGEFVQLQVVDFVSIVDTTTTGEFVQLQVVDFVSVIDVTTTAESVQMQVVDFVSVSDSTTTNESVTLQEVYAISVSDSTTTGEALTVREIYNVSVSDSTTTTEALTIEEIYFISVSDSTTTAESLSISAAFQSTLFINVSDSTTVRESVVFPETITPYLFIFVDGRLAIRLGRTNQYTLI